MPNRFATLSLSVALMTLLSVLRIAQADATHNWKYSGKDNSGLGDRSTFLRPPIARRDLELYSERLDLSEEQLAFVTDRYEALVAEYRSQWLDFTELRTDARYASQIDTDWQTINLDIRQSKLDQKEHIESMVDDFMSDLRIVLTPTQEQEWTVIQRDRTRRETLTKYTCFNDERFDLVECVRTLDLTGEEKVGLDELLEQYAQTIQPVLEHRNRRIEELAEAYLEMEGFNLEFHSMMRKGEPFGPEQQFEWSKRREEFQDGLVSLGLNAREACARVRDVNVRFRTEIKRLLPDRVMEEFDKATKPKPRNTKNKWWNDDSRVARIITTLKNLEATKTMMISYAANAGDDEEAQEFLMLMLAAEPLSASQVRTLDDIKQRHKEARERIKERYAPDHSAKGKEIDESKTFTVHTPAAGLRFQHVEYEPERNPSSESDDDGELRLEMLRELNTIEQDTMNEIRSILTTSQRMVIAAY